MTGTRASRRALAGGLIAQAAIGAVVLIVAPGTMGKPSGILPVMLGAAAGIALYLALCGPNSLPRRIDETAPIGALALQCLVVSIVAASEEIIWRGALFSILGKFGWVVTLTITTIGFAALHAYSQSMRGVRTHSITGLVFGLLRLWSGSVAVPMAAHVLYNTLVVIAGSATRHRRLPAVHSQALL
jgi:membrane protease YdiL (CAAX protease family)